MLFYPSIHPFIHCNLPLSLSHLPIDCGHDSYGKTRDVRRRGIPYLVSPYHVASSASLRRVPLRVVALSIAGHVSGTVRHPRSTHSSPTFSGSELVRCPQQQHRALHFILCLSLESYFINHRAVLCSGWQHHDCLSSSFFRWRWLQGSFFGSASS
jgi:hypothetical protein